MYQVDIKEKSHSLYIVYVSFVVGVLICLSVLILSWSHATGLFARSGYEGWLGQIGVFAFEITFVFSTGIAIWSSWVGEKVTGPTRFVLILGVLFNLYSNITSGIAQDGKPIIFTTIQGIPINEPVLIGALIPTLFFAIERVIANAIFMYRKIKDQATDLSNLDSISDKTLEENLAADQTKVGDESEDHLAEIKQASELSDEEKVEAMGVVGEVISKGSDDSDKPNLTADLTNESNESDKDQTSNLTESEQNQTEGLAIDQTKVAQISDSQSDKNRTIDLTNYEQISESQSDENLTLDLTKVRQINSANRTKKTTKKSSSRKKISDPKQHTKEVALKFYNTHKRLPKIRELEGLAGTSKYYASEAIKEIKEEKKIS